ncbi:MAG: hypothetical protein IPL10_02300 [Bacteroidetes bacterium]|nr:hypothetical protein [Bacteroidota bacterium]
MPEFIYAHKRDYIRDTYFSPQRISGHPNTPQQACTNIDFESGNLNGWSTSTGYNPAYNALGCCQNAGGAQSNQTGAGIDVGGGFPLVAAGGKFFCKIRKQRQGRYCR